MSKQLFEIMRAQEMATLYDSTFTKREASETGANLTKAVLEAGEVDKMHFGANLARLNEVISSALSTFRDSIIDTEKVKALGVEFNPVNGGETLNYKDDEVYLTLFNDLKEREELLKLAYKAKSSYFDQYGNIIPKVSSTPRKSSITIKF
jgi:hypothetical protein